jgi:myo-inositol-1(or 4)-monophosphatase
LKGTVYGQLVQILAQYTRVLKDREPEAAHTAAAAAVADATDAFAAATAAPPTAVAAPRKALRIRKNGNPTADDAPT